MKKAYGNPGKRTHRVSNQKGEWLLTKIGIREKSYRTNNTRII
jgi:hypothetical protein